MAGKLLGAFPDPAVVLLRTQRVSSAPRNTIVRVLDRAEITASAGRGDAFVPQTPAPAFGLPDLLSERTCADPLEMLDLRVLVHLVQRSGAQLTPSQGMVAQCGEHELALAVHGRPVRGGSDRRALIRSIDRLCRAVVTLHDCDLVAGSVPGHVSRAPLIRASTGGPRLAPVRFDFSPWFASTVLTGSFPLLDLSVMRRLRSTSERLWAYLEGTTAFRLTVPGTERAVVALDERLLFDLRVRYRRSIEARRSVEAAADRIRRVDRRYLDFRIVRRRAGWLLRVHRRVQTTTLGLEPTGPVLSRPPATRES